MLLNFTDEDEIEIAFNYFRKTGFPYDNLTDYEIMAIFRKLQAKEIQLERKTDLLFDDGYTMEITSDSIGQKVVNHFHKHIYESQAMGMRSAIQSFGIDKSLRAALKLAIKFGEHVDTDSMRTLLKRVHGTQICSNFRPLAAKTMYEYYCKDIPNARILDMSTGYGGRLLGFLASDLNGAHYFGVDPSERTCKANLEILKFFKADHLATIIQSPFEDVPQEKLVDIDFMFTSPPYFNKEIYDTDNPTQSMNRYSKYDAWYTQFWKVCINKIVTALKPGGVIAVNIADITTNSKRYPLVADTIAEFLSIGLTKLDHIDLVFSTFGKGISEEKNKAEPILVYQKGGKL